MPLGLVNESVWASLSGNKSVSWPLPVCKVMAVKVLSPNLRAIKAIIFPSGDQVISPKIPPLETV